MQHCSSWAWMQFSALWIRLKESIRQKFEKTDFSCWKDHYFHPRYCVELNGSGIQLLLFAPPVGSIGRWYSRMKTQVCCEYKALFILWMRALYLGENAQKSASFLLASCCSPCLYREFSRVAAQGNRRVGYIGRTAGVHLFVTLEGRKLGNKLVRILWERLFTSAWPDSCKYSALLHDKQETQNSLCQKRASFSGKWEGQSLIFISSCNDTLLLSLGTKGD